MFKQCSDCLLPASDRHTGQQGRTSNQAQKSHFNNFSQSFTPSASVPGKEMHSMPSGWLFSGTWESQTDNSNTPHLKVLLHIWAALHLWAWSGSPWKPQEDLLSSGQSHCSSFHLFKQTTFTFSPSIKKLSDDVAKPNDPQRFCSSLLGQEAWTERCSCSSG